MKSTTTVMDSSMKMLPAHFMQIPIRMDTETPTSVPNRANNQADMCPKEMIVTIHSPRYTQVERKFAMVLTTTVTMKSTKD